MELLNWGHLLTYICEDECSTKEGQCFFSRIPSDLDKFSRFR